MQEATGELLHDGRAEEEDAAAPDVRAAIVCAACDQVMLGEDQKPRTKPAAHACKQCLRDLHSFIVCDSIWMPIENAYFCSSECIKSMNSSVLHEANECRGPTEPEIQVGYGTRWESFLREAELYPLRRRPEDGNDEQEELLDASCFTCEPQVDKPQLADRGHPFQQVIEELDAHREEVMDAIDEEEVRPEEVEQGIDEEVNCPGDDGDESAQDEEVKGEPDMAISDAVMHLITEGLRVQVAFPQSDTDAQGLWFGGIVGDTRTKQPFHTSTVFIGYDDGELVEHHLDELQVRP